MALRKIYLAIDCKDDAERNAVQTLANEISNMRALNGAQLISIAPTLYNNKDSLRRLFRLIATGGPKALLSMEGAKALMSLRNNK